MTNAGDYGRAKQQHVLAGFMPYLDAEIERQRCLIETTALAQLRAGALTPDAAFSFWTQIGALNSIRKGFETRVRIGASAGERLNADLTGDRQPT